MQKTMRVGFTLGLGVVLFPTLALADVTAEPPHSNITHESPALDRDSVTALDDATIVAIFDFANTADIETGRLATRLGSTKEVRDFGAMLVLAHEQVRKLGRDLAKKLAVTPTPPANDQAPKDHAVTMARLEKLKGDRAGQHSIRVNDQWRICFRWKDADAYEVEIVDYH